MSTEFCLAMNYFDSKFWTMSQLSTTKFKFGQKNPPVKSILDISLKFQVYLVRSDITL
jgi:hypothetical protein